MTQARRQSKSGNAVQTGHNNPRILNVRLTPEESAMLEHYRERLQHRYGNKVRVTFKTVVLEALETLGQRLERTDD
jgi:hypothetical protein